MSDYMLTPSDKKAFDVWREMEGEKIFCDNERCLAAWKECSRQKEERIVEADRLASELNRERAALFEMNVEKNKIIAELQKRVAELESKLNLVTHNKGKVHEHAHLMQTNNADLRGRIAELEAQIPRWIPVTERLPENIFGMINWVLVSYVFEGFRYQTIGHYRASRRNTYWTDSHHTPLKVTHWQSLPEAPDGK